MSFTCAFISFHWLRRCSLSSSLFSLLKAKCKENKPGYLKCIDSTYDWYVKIKYIKKSAVQCKYKYQDYKIMYLAC